MELENLEDEEEMSVKWQDYKCELLIAISGDMKEELQSLRKYKVCLCLQD